MISNDNSHKLLTLILGELDDLLLPYMIDLSFYVNINNENLKDHINRIGNYFYIKSKS